jgi:hypothetical protein
MKNYLPIILIAMLSLQCTSKAAKEKYRIPYGFKGQVFIFFNMQNGQPKKYENGFRVYNIPSNGILATQFKAKYGTRTLAEYSYEYGDSLGSYYPIDNFPQGVEPPDSNQVYITAEETGGGGIKHTYEYQTFNVKTNRDSLILVNRWSDGRFDKILKIAGIQ